MKPSFIVSIQAMRLGAGRWNRRESDGGGSWVFMLSLTHFMALRVGVAAGLSSPPTQGEG